LQNAGIWGTASQCLNWATSSTSGNQAWSNNSSNTGFWDDPAPVRSSTTAKQSVKQTTITKSTSSQQQQLQNNNNKASKSKNKRDEELVKKLFEQNTAKTDEFTQWCNKALNSIQASVDSKSYAALSCALSLVFLSRVCIYIYICNSSYIRWIFTRYRIGI
jgi:PERQ amino acid-rich with GYF domain-containing protein